MTPRTAPTTQEFPVKILDAEERVVLAHGAVRLIGWGTEFFVAEDTRLDIIHEGYMGDAFVTVLGADVRCHSGFAKHRWWMEPGGSITLLKGSRPLLTITHLESGA